MAKKITIELTEPQLNALVRAAQTEMEDPLGRNYQSYIDLLGRALYSIDQSIIRKGG